MEVTTVMGLYRFARIIAERNGWAVRYEGIKLPRIICGDGFSMSVQAGRMYYSSPREDLADEYTAFEIGYPSYRESLLDEYCEVDPDMVQFDEDNFEAVYPFVPTEVIQQVIDKHGGFLGIDPTGGES